MCYPRLLFAATVFFACFWQVSALPSASADTIPVNGVELNYVSAGSGTPVVFVHGAIADARLWEVYKPFIADTRRYVALDQRYHGTEKWPDEGKAYQIETHVEDLIAFIEALDAGPVHVVTWSYSGQIGTYAALRRPDLFRSMVHFEPAVDALAGEISGSQVAHQEFVSQFGPAIDAVKAGKLEDASVRFLEAVWKLPEGKGDEEPADMIKVIRDNGRTIPPLLGMDPPPELTCQSLSHLRVPTLVVQGSETFAHFAMMAEHLARCQSNALLVTMKGVNHDGPYRKAEELAGLIENFLDLVE